MWYLQMVYLVNHYRNSLIRTKLQTTADFTFEAEPPQQHRPTTAFIAVQMPLNLVTKRIRNYCGTLRIR